MFLTAINLGARPKRHALTKSVARHFVVESLERRQLLATIQVFPVAGDDTANINAKIALAQNGDVVEF